MSEINTNVLKDGQLSVATVAQSGTIVSKPSEVNATVLVQTEDGKQLCVPTVDFGEGGGGGGGSAKGTYFANFTGNNFINAKTACPASYSTAQAFVHTKISKFIPQSTEGYGQILLSTTNDSGNIGFAGDGPYIEVYNGSDGTRGSLQLETEEHDYWFRFDVSGTTGNLYYIKDGNYTYATLPTSLSSWTSAISNVSSFTWANKTLQIGRNATNFGPQGAKIYDVKVLFDNVVHLDLQNASTLSVIGNVLPIPYF